MKILSRDFTRGEKVLLLLLALVVLVLAYFQFVFKPVREGIAKAEAESANLETELTVVKAKVSELERMQHEIDDIMADENISTMPSYNNKKAVNTLLSDILGNMKYSATLSNMTRNGNQIRRIVQLQFDAPSYAAMEQVLDRLSGSPYRCLIDNVSCSNYWDRYNDVDAYNVTLTATFFETLVGGTEDAALPPDSGAAAN